MPALPGPILIQVKPEPIDVDLLTAPPDVYEEISDEQIRDALSVIKNVRLLFELVFSSVS